MSPSEGFFRHDRNHHDVFISYAQEDKPIADAVCVKLESRHIRCWIAPRDVPVGKNFPEAIMDGIEGCKIMVMIFSSYSNSSPHVLRELTTAVNKGRIIVPFRIEDVLPSKSIEYLISVPHWMDAITPPLEKHIDELATTIRHILSPESAESICTSCKTPLSPNALFCENCGASVTASPPPPPAAEPPAEPQPPQPVIPSPPAPEPVPPVAASPAAHPSPNRKLLIGAAIVGVVLVVLAIAAFTVNFSSLLPTMGIQINGGANTQVTAAPTQVNYRSENALVNTVSLTTAPTQALPEGNRLTIVAEKSPINLEVIVKFEGGPGQGFVQDNQVILTRSDGTITQGKLDFNRKPSELSLQGTRGTDRLQVIVTLRSGETYTIVDQLLLYRSRG